MNLVVWIPNEFYKWKVWVLISVFFALKSKRFSKNFLFTSLCHVISWSNSEEMESRLRQNTELISVSWVELSLKEFLRLARQFGFRHHKFLVVFNIKDRNSKIWDTSDHQQVSSISGESHTNAFDCCVHSEAVGKFLGGCSIYMDFWVETIFGGSNQPIVVIRGDHAVTVSLWPDVFLSAIDCVPKNNGTSCNLNSSAIFNERKVKPVVGKARLAKPQIYLVFKSNQLTCCCSSCVVLFFKF